MTRTRSASTILSILLVLSMLAAGCAGGDDDSGATSDTETSVFDQGSGSDDSGDVGDAEEVFSGDADSADSDDSMQDQAGDADAMDDGGADAEAPADTADRAAPATEGGTGLFAEEDAIEPAPEPPIDDDPQPARIREFVDTRDDPLSTFALDVDTGAYTLARRTLQAGSWPDPSSVRVEEFVNFFDYGYDDPRGDALGITTDGAPSPFDEDNYLLRVGVQSQRIDDSDRPPVSLTFVIDTSGSMRTDDRLELVKDSLEELVEELDGDDTVSIVEFDDDPSIVLRPTRVDDEDEILDAIDDLRPGGSTNVEAGLELGYEMANTAFRDDGVNRVILLSDGVANVGLTDPDGLSRMIRDDADAGIQLLTIGVGLGDFNDVLMEQLADQGDGFYAYIDTRDEAERLFEERLTATLVTLAIDAKIQVEFDEDVVESYRLIGFENRGVLDSDFRNDDVDAGEIGAGHQVTAIYEIELQRGVDLDDRDDIGEVRLRWEEPGTGEVIEIDHDIELSDLEESWDDTDDSLKLATVVAAFAEVLRNSPYADDIELDDVAEAAEELADRSGDRDIDELAELIWLAEERR